MKDNCVYKIMNSEGKYSSGGSTPKFTHKGGKVWNSIGALKNHLRQFSPKPRKIKFHNDEYSGEYEKTEMKNPIPKDWVVVSLEVTGEVCKAYEIFGCEV